MTSPDDGTGADGHLVGTREGSSVKTAVPVVTTARTGRLGLWRNADFLVAAAAILVATVLTLSGLSGSSLSVLSPDGSWDSSLVAGTPRMIRSDEYLVFSPIKVGQVEAGFPRSRVFGMGTIDTSDSWRHQVPSKSIGHILFSPFNTPLLFLPISQGFAAYWWGPFLICFLGVYSWYRLLGARWRIAAPGAILIVATPAAVWWSGWQLVGIAHATVACSLVIAATKLLKSRRVIAVILAVFGAFAAAGLPWFYQPWAIVAALFVGSATVLWGLSVPQRRHPFSLVAAIATTVFIAESIVFLMHERAYYEALANTVYPGARRFTGGGVGLGQLLSSLFAATVTGVDGSVLTNTNLSEFSSGWTIALVIAVALAIAARRSLRRDPERLLVVGALVISVALSSWSVINWGYLARFQPLTLVAPERVAPFIGFFGVTCLVILTGQRDRWRSLMQEIDREIIAIVAAFILLTTLWGITEGRRVYLPTASWRTVMMILLIVGLIAGLILAGRAVAGLAIAAFVALVISISVNPLMRGIGALETSDAAAKVESIDRLIGSSGSEAIWAGDDLYLVPLLNGTGVNSLSSINDPVDLRGWRTLDPGNQYEQQWNRFAYIVFRWEPGLASPIIESAQPDVIVVAVDPCDAALDDLGLNALVSSSPISGSCLTPKTQVDWQGTTRTIFQREKHTPG